MRRLFRPFNFIVDGDAIAENCAELRGLPATMFEHFAVTNPRPSGLLLRTLAIYDGKDFWLLTPSEWAAEAAWNSGVYMSLLLRHPEHCPDASGFARLFSSVEAAYQVLMHRTDWVKQNRQGPVSAQLLTHLMAELTTELSALERDFVAWAQPHQQAIQLLVRSLLDDVAYSSGSAAQEWRQAEPAWHSSTTAGNA